VIQPSLVRRGAYAQAMASNELALDPLARIRAGGQLEGGKVPRSAQRASCPGPLEDDASRALDDRHRDPHVDRLFRGSRGGVALGSAFLARAAA